MEDGFELPVRYRKEDLLLPAQLVSFGWTHRIQVDVYGTTVYFERDEAGEWRALLAAEDLGLNKSIDLELVKAIAAARKSFRVRYKLSLTQRSAWVVLEFKVSSNNLLCPDVKSLQS